MAAMMTWFLGKNKVLAKDHLQIKEEIGQGYGGLVYKGFLSMNFDAPQPVAVKQLKPGTAQPIVNVRSSILYIQF